MSIYSKEGNDDFLYDVEEIGIISDSPHVGEIFDSRALCHSTVGINPSSQHSLSFRHADEALEMGVDRMTKGSSDQQPPLDKLAINTPISGSWTL